MVAGWPGYFFFTILLFSSNFNIFIFYKLIFKGGLCHDPPLQIDF
jgi:hypothetical protein